MNNIITFWQGDKSNPTAYLSNFYHAPFEATVYNDDIIKFEYSEQYFMYLKALYFKQPRTAEYIAENPQLRPNDFKKIGRQLPFYDKYGNSWESNGRIDAMHKAVLAKFSENKQLKAKLIATGDAVLIEASPYDRYWGAGVNANTIAKTKTYPGVNQLGQILMAIRKNFKTV